MVNEITDHEIHRLLPKEQDSLLLKLFYPNTGPQYRPISLIDLQSTAFRIPYKEAKNYWKKVYNLSPNCQHTFFDGFCELTNCDVCIKKLFFKNKNLTLNFL